ncbi:DUF3307 domain-containing protein [Vibrio sp. EA2]|uniref:DUF3307 domain-containing protein n=1 Tax=Vibrio sp. EA2 TaxID=3079860 RepID=UPI0029490012|nr:DUF3307 domain-containing protein [Vibrio sp. EA2]MDV6251084.1 DUF3307 domain-containing protein [Vibrio sp. EA2]
MMTDFFGVLTLFLISHIFADFPLQPDSWVKAKKDKMAKALELYMHVALHGAIQVIPALIIGLDWQSTFSLVLLVAVSHFFIDWVKAVFDNYADKEGNDLPQKGYKLRYFLIDQLAHIFVLAAIAVHVVGGVSIQSVFEHERFLDGAMVLLGYMLLLKPTSILIGTVLQKYPLSKNATDENSELPDDGLDKAGEFIGYLERSLIFTFTLAGSYAAVGFVLAAKSIFRFGELNAKNNRGLTEYVLIGSLLSVVIATLVGTLISLAIGYQIK